MGSTEPARFHFLVAKEAPVAVVLRRKPSRMFHVLRWNTRTDSIEHGSWFSGRIHPDESDISFDGEWMIYSALGGRGDEFTGLCHPPHLKTVLYQTRNNGDLTGGYWSDATTLTTPCAVFGSPANPFKFSLFDWNPKVPRYIGHCRRQRDGWILDGKDWCWRPTDHHPVLRNHGEDFTLEGMDSVLESDVSAAAWNSKGDLLVGRAGCLYRYTLADLESGQPSFSLDLEGLQGPPKKGGPAIVVPA